MDERLEAFVSSLCQLAPSDAGTGRALVAVAKAAAKLAEWELSSGMSGICTDPVCDLSGCVEVRVLGERLAALGWQHEE